MALNTGNQEMLSYHHLLEAINKPGNCVGVDFESAENRREDDLNQIVNGVIHQMRKPNDLAGTPDRSPAVSESPQMQDLRAFNTFHQTFGCNFGRKKAIVFEGQKNNKL